MKKKLLSLIVAVVLVASMLVACGNSSTTTTAAPATAAPTEAAPAETKAAADIPAQTITLTTTFSENEYAGQLITHLKEELSNLSNGAINLDIYWGGTVAATGEELSFVGGGSMDMTIIGQSMYTDKLSLLNFPSQVLNGYEDSVNLIDYIAFENEETAPLVQAEIEANNVKMLGSLPGGSNAFITKTEYKTLDEMKGLKLGIGMNQSAMEELGFNVVTMMPWDYYDQLSRGVADAGYMSVSALVSMSLQEVTPFFLKDGTYTAGNLVTINLDKWNSFDDATKAVFEDAVAATQVYSFTVAGSMDDGAKAAIEAAGGALNVMNESDAARVQSAFFKTGVADARMFGEAAGTSEAMEVVLKNVAEYIGLELPAK